MATGYSMATRWPLDGRVSDETSDETSDEISDETSNEINSLQSGVGLVLFRLLPNPAGDHTCVLYCIALIQAVPEEIRVHPIQVVNGKTSNEFPFSRAQFIRPTTAYA